MLDKVISGVRWTSLGSIAKQVMQFGFGVILARLLIPEDFGKLGMVTVVTGFLLVFSDIGLGAALINKRNPVREDWETANATNIGIGVILALLLAVSAGFIADFYGDNDLILICRILSITFILRSASSIYTTQFIKQLNFKLLARIEIFSSATSNVVSVVAALMGLGYWSLVVRQVTNQIFLLAGLFYATEKYISIRYHNRSFRELISFGVGLTGFNILNYWSRNADNLLIGKYLGQASLGIYMRAYGLLTMPLAQIHRVLSPVIFPALSAINDDPDRLRTSYFRILRVVIAVISPLMLLLFVTSREFILFVYGSQWIDAAPVLRFLALIGVVQVGATTTGWLFTALGRTKLLFWWGVGSSIWTVAAILYGVQFGLVGLTKVYALSSAIMSVPLGIIVSRIIGGGVVKFIIRMVPIIIGILLSGVICYYSILMLGSTIQAGIVLFVAWIVALAIYWTYLKIFDSETVTDVLRIVRRR
jgi:O-antigen/teichoic acid export membrane protein